MTAASPLVFEAVLGVVLQTEPIDPNIVKPGWTPLLITVLLLVVLVFLFFSMQKQMRRIRTPDDIAREQEAERRARAESVPNSETDLPEARPEEKRPEAR